MGRGVKCMVTDGGSIIGGRMLQYTLVELRCCTHRAYNAINQTNIFLNVHPQTDFLVIMILKVT